MKTIEERAMKSGLGYNRSLKQKTVAFLLLLVVGCSFLPKLALATAPADQIVSPDPPGGSLYSVVDFMLAGGNSDNGTGSIINKFKDTNGIGHFCVLTADHVIAGNVNRVA